MYGKNLKDSNKEILPGTIYLDLATNEFFYDDPTGEKQVHEKIIDTATLIYTIVGESLTYPSPGSEDEDIPGVGGGENAGGTSSAVLGIAVLGTMKLGTP